MTETKKTEKSDRVLFNKPVYDTIKWLVQVAFPAFATLYVALSEIWGLPYTLEIVGTLTAITTFLGILLGISSARYHNSDNRFDGVMRVEEGETGKDVYNLELKDEPDNLSRMRELTFKVENYMKNRNAQK